MDDSLRRPAPIAARDVARILRRRAPIALLVFVLVCVGVLMMTKRQRKTYEAQASILLDAPASGIGVSDEIMGFMGHSGSAPLEIEIAKIQSRKFMENVAHNAGLGTVDANSMRGRVMVSAGPNGQILLVNARAETAAEAQKIANTVVSTYITAATQEFYDKTTWTESRLTEARDKAYKDKLDTEAQLQAFTSKVGLSSPMVLYSREANRTVDARAALADSQKMLPVSEQQLAKLQQMIKTVPETVVNGYSMDKFGAIDQYRNEISRLQTQRNDLTLDYAPDSLEVKTLDAQIKNRQDALVDAQKDVYAKGGQSVGRNGDYVRLQSQIYDTQLNIASLQQNIRAWSRQLASLEDEQRRLAPEQIRYEQLQRARDDANSAYEKEMTGLRQLRQSRLTSIPYIHPLDMAPLPGGPISPKPLLNAVMAVFVGLFLGIVTALIVEYFAGGFDHEVVIEDLPTVGGVPLLGRLPAALPALSAMTGEGNRGLPTAQGAAHPLAVVGGAPSWAFEDALREIGYFLTHRDRQAPVPIVLLTSVRSDDSTARLAAQLTATMVRDGLRVTLVDGDRDSPRLNRFFGAPDAPGLTDVLSNRTKLVDALHTGVNGALRFLAAGSPVTGQPPASEERLRSVFRELSADKEATDVIFVSGPTVWNARQIAPLEKAAGGMVLLTFGENGAPDESVARVRRLLSNGYKPGILGVIVENAPVAAHGTTVVEPAVPSAPIGALAAPVAVTNAPAPAGEEILP